MRIEKRTMGWFPKQSTWNHQQSLNAKRRAQAHGHMAEQSALASGIFAARETANAGAVEVAIKAAVARLTKKTA